MQYCCWSLFVQRLWCPCLLTPSHAANRASAAVQRFHHAGSTGLKSPEAAHEVCRRVLEIIAALCELETRAKSLSFNERKAICQKESEPLLSKLNEYLKQLETQTLPKHALQQPVKYALSQWTEIVRYTEDGIFEIDNDAMERDIGPIAPGRKKYLFAGSHEGARRMPLISWIT